MTHYEVPSDNNIRTTGSNGNRIDSLEDRIETLEARIAELEQQHSETDDE